MTHIPSETSVDTTPVEPPSRRDMLYLVTGSVAAVGAAATIWPLIDQMNPDAATIAAAGPVDIDVSQIQEGQRLVTLWAARPVFVVRRPQAALDTLRDPKLISQLRDPNSDNWQQPEYARNWSRSIKPEFLVVVGICTHLGCVPLYDPEPERHRSGAGLARRLLLPVPRLEIRSRRPGLPGGARAL